MTRLVVQAGPSTSSSAVWSSRSGRLCTCASHLTHTRPALHHKVRIFPLSDVNYEMLRMSNYNNRVPSIFNTEPKKLLPQRNSKHCSIPGCIHRLSSWYSDPYETVAHATCNRIHKSTIPVVDKSTCPQAPCPSIHHAKKTKKIGFKVKRSVQWK